LVGAATEPPGSQEASQARSLDAVAEHDVAFIGLQ